MLHIVRNQRDMVILSMFLLAGLWGMILVSGCSKEEPLKTNEVMPVKSDQASSAGSTIEREPMTNTMQDQAY